MLRRNLSDEFVVRAFTEFLHWDREPGLFFALHVVSRGNSQMLY